MNSRLKIMGISLFAIVVMGAGCQKVSNNNLVEPASSTSAQGDINQEYSWKEEGISFKYPKNMTVINLEKVLFLNAGNNKYIPQGDASIYYTRIEVVKNKTIDQVLKPYYDNDKILKGKTMKKIGDYNFTRLQYEDYKYDYIVDQYFLQVGNNVLDYKAGYKDNKGDVELTLSSLKFNQ